MGRKKKTPQDKIKQYVVENLEDVVESDASQTTIDFVIKHRFPIVALTLGLTLYKNYALRKQNKALVKRIQKSGDDSIFNKFFGKTPQD